MATPPAKRRKAATPSPQRTVKATILLDVQTHAKLAAAAALRGCDRSTLALSFITEGLKGMVVFDRNANPSDKLGSDVEVDRAE